MNCFNVEPSARAGIPGRRNRLIYAILILSIAASLSACGSKEKKAGQALVRVNGEEITALQLNDELGRARVQPNQQEAASKQLLETLIDQQVILAEAIRNKIDRSPAVLQAIERAKKQIIAQTYLQSVTGKIPKISATEINNYYNQNPEFFTQRKMLYMRVLAIEGKDLSNELKSFMDKAKSLEEVAAWLTKNDVQFLRGRGARDTASLPPEMAKKLQTSPKGTLFIVNEGARSMLVSLDDIKDSPVTVKEAEPRIERALAEKKIKEAIEAEVTHLRSQAKIEYLNASAPVPASPKAGGS